MTPETMTAPAALTIKPKKRVNFHSVPDEKWRSGGGRRRRHSSLPPRRPRAGSEDLTLENEADDLVKLCVERARDGLAAIRALTRLLESHSSARLSGEDSRELRDKLSDLSLAATKCAVVAHRRKKGKDLQSSPPPLLSSSSSSGSSGGVGVGVGAHHQKWGGAHPTKKKSSYDQLKLPPPRLYGRQQMMLDMALTRCPSYQTLDPDSPVDPPRRLLSPLPPPPGPPPPLMPLDIPGDENHPVALHSLRQQRNGRKRLLSPCSSSHRSDVAYSDLEPPSTASSLEDFDYDDEFNAVDIPEYPACRSSFASTESSHIINQDKVILADGDGDDDDDAEPTYDDDDDAEPTYDADDAEPTYGGDDAEPTYGADDAEPTYGDSEKS